MKVQQALERREVRAEIFLERRNRALHYAFQYERHVFPVVNGSLLDCNFPWLGLGVAPSH